MALDPSTATAAGREALAVVLVSIREQAIAAEDDRLAAAAQRGLPPPAPLARSWKVFAEIAQRNVGLSLSPGNLKKLAPTPSYGNVPNPGVFYALDSWGVFKFDNGEPITAIALYEVLLELRTPQGDLVRRVRNGSR